MYRLGRRIHSQHLLIYGFAFLAVIVAGVSVLAHFYFKHPATEITQSHPVTLSVIGAGSSTKTFNQGIYSIDLPSDWKYVGLDPTTIYHPAIFENTADNAGSRQLDVYVDNLPTVMGVNLMVPVSASGNRVVPGAVSGNCVNFTSTTNINPNGGSLSKWSDVNFYCDTHNYERDVVGTSSADAINSITLNGPINGTHSFFFTYTDDTSQPDYSIFTNALASFVLK